MDELTLLRKIADAAFTVRDRQQTYFRTRDPEVLHRSKTAEQHLDELITQYREGIAVQQIDIFSSPRPP